MMPFTEKEVIINRFKVTKNYTLGDCYIRMETGQIFYVGKVIERGWRNNAVGISCAPEGTYKIVLEYSNRFKKDLWELKGVPNRSEIKFHAANYWRELNGCLALGNKHKDIDGDGDPDVTSSRPVMKKFHEMMGNSKVAKVTIKNL